MHGGWRAAAETVEGCDQRIPQPALKAENHQQRHENRRKPNIALDLSHAAFNLSHSGSRGISPGVPGGFRAARISLSGRNRTPDNVLTRFWPKSGLATEPSALHTSGSEAIEFVSVPVGLRPAGLLPHLRHAQVSQQPQFSSGKIPFDYLGVQPEGPRLPV